MTISRVPLDRAMSPELRAFLDDLSARVGDSSSSSSSGINVKDSPYNAVGDGTTDDTAAIQAALDAADTDFVSPVFIPKGDYYVPGGLVVPRYVNIIGADQTQCRLLVHAADVTTLALSGNNFVSHLRVEGSGTETAVGFGGSNPAIHILPGGGGCLLFRMTARGGSCPLELDNDASDSQVAYCFFFQPYSNFIVHGGPATWYYRCSFNHQSESPVVATDTIPYSNWASATAYTAGDVRITQGYAIICIADGTSGGSPPTLMNYAVDIVDNTATWRLYAPDDLFMVFLQGAFGETKFDGCDYSSEGAHWSVVADSGGDNSRAPTVSIAQAVTAAPAKVSDCLMFSITDSQAYGALVESTMTGHFHFSDNWTHTSLAEIHIAANVSDFIITDNFMNGAPITVDAGTSDYYIIENNLHSTVTDNGTGVNKNVSNNFA